MTSNQIKKHKNFYSCPCTNSVSMQTPVEVRTDNDNEHTDRLLFDIHRELLTAALGLLSGMQIDVLLIGLRRKHLCI